ncbi:hypothetical protein [Spirillospora sp. CA-294931]|uniref:hypothetical protein n=1 Tax=Spirillospora sp. CA-294931 TaxID=3240042 RepID=UPI003D91D316
MRLPRSPSDGPRRTDRDLVSGFGHTPNGALLAAIHIVVRAAPQWAPDVFESTITHQVIGPDKVELLESIRSAHEQLRKRARLPVGVALGRAHAAIEGFRFLGYTPSLASLDLLSAGPGEDDLTVRAATRVQLRWHDGDWRAICPLGGDWGSSAVPITSTAGYTLFPTGR